MKPTRIILFFALGLTLVVFSCKHANPNVEAIDAGPRAAVDEIKEGSAQLAMTRARVDEMIDAGDYAGAEALVDQELPNPGHGPLMAMHKAELLARRGAKPEAVDMFLELVRGTYGAGWDAAQDYLKPALDFAVELNRTADSDEIAAAILARQTAQFTEYDSLQTPTTANTATKRLAYAYLVIACAAISIDKTVQFAYCQKARDLLPNDTIVLARTADAYHSRGQEGDGAQARSLLSQAWQQSPASSELRTAIQEMAHTFGYGTLP